MCQRHLASRSHPLDIWLLDERGIPARPWLTVILDDYILIDSPPSLGIFTVNALTAADAVIVPLQAHVFALQALPQLEETIAIVRQLNPSLSIGGIVVTMIDRRTSMNQVVEDAARQQYGDLVFKTVIPFNVKLVEAPAAGQPISAYAPGSSGARAYHDLALEVAARYGK